MCGINGGWVPGGLNRAHIETSLELMVHRGPDDSGVLEDHPVFLGNRRLSIIDIQGGRQPMANEDGSVHVVLNGEIYNYKELMEDLHARGHRFRTKSDTEVLVHVYEEYGTEMCHKLRGMFAFAVWDRRTRTLFLGRDRFGKKPLYYMVDGGTFLFASEIQALRYLAESLEYRWQIRDQGIYDYLSLGFIPQPETVFDKVHALPAGSWMRYDGRTKYITRYWSLSYEPKLEIPYSQVLKRTRGLVSEAVRLRLRSDVPLGIFLSGGIDSSVVAYEAAQLAGESLRTLTVKMADSSMDESPIALQTAESLGLNSSVISLKVDPSNDLPAVVRAYGQPMADPSAIPTLRLSQLASEHVKVVLNGDGGDEVFAGYRRYLAFRYRPMLSWLPSSCPGLFGRLAHRMAGSRRTSVSGFAARVLAGLPLSQGARYLAWTMDCLRDEDKQRIWANAPMRATEEWLESIFPAGYSELDTAMSADIRGILLNALLVKIDIATMSASVEARSPLLDHVLAEFVACLPDSYKIRYGGLKSLLRDAYSGLLPAQVVRGKKRGFDPPLNDWLKGELHPVVMDTLGSGSAHVKAYLDPQFIQDLVQGRVMRDRNWAVLLYTLLILELWLRMSSPRAAPAGQTIPIISAGESPTTGKETKETWG